MEEKKRSFQLRGEPRRGRHRDYALTAILVASGVGCTNAALNYVSYPVRIMAKSSAWQRRCGVRIQGCLRLAMEK